MAWAFIYFAHYEKLYFHLISTALSFQNFGIQIWIFHSKFNQRIWSWAGWQKIEFVRKLQRPSPPSSFPFRKCYSQFLADCFVIEVWWGYYLELEKWCCGLWEWLIFVEGNQMLIFNMDTFLGWKSFFGSVIFLIFKVLDQKLAMKDNNEWFSHFMLKCYFKKLKIKRIDTFCT